MDRRLPAFEPGLGVIEDKEARFYPLRSIPSDSILQDRWLGRPIRVVREHAISAQARWVDEEVIPMQLLSRWYGFSFTYPGCSVYGPENEGR